MPKRVASESPPVPVSSTYRKGVSGDQSRAPGSGIVCRTARDSPGPRVTRSAGRDATRAAPFHSLTAWTSSKATGALPRFASLVSTRTSEDDRRGATWTVSITGLSESSSDTSS